MSTTPESSSRIEALLKELITKVENSSGGGGEITITIDDKLNSSSTNPVQNNVITAELGKKADTSALSRVATSGSYTDLENKPELPPVIDTSRFALQDAIAEEYNTSKEYHDGDMFMFNGSLYCVDSEGDYIKSENLITAEAYDVENGYVVGKIPSNASNTSDTYNERWYYTTLGYVPIIPNAMYRFVPSGIYRGLSYSDSHAFYSEKGTRISTVSINTVKDGTTADASHTFTAPTGAYYVRLGVGDNADQLNRQLYRLYTNMPKVRKVDVCSKFGGLSIHAPMTQEEYDALEAYDSATLYPIVG